MHKKRILSQIEKLRTGLQELEEQLANGEVPPEALEDFKKGIDHVRTTIWAILAEKTDQYEVTTFLARFRVLRAMELCSRILADLEARNLATDSPEVEQLRVVLRETLARIEQRLAARRKGA